MMQPAARARLPAAAGKLVRKIFANKGTTTTTTTTSTSVEDDNDDNSISNGRHQKEKGCGAIAAPATESSPLISDDPLPPQESYSSSKDAEAQRIRRRRRTAAAANNLNNIQDWQWQFALCFICFTNAYLLFNSVPYAPFMVVDLIESATPENAGRYSGFITSAFTTARSTSVGWWGSYADKKGRVRAIQVSLALCSVTTILFGLSTNYVFALVWRFMLGLCCPLGALAKTCVTELVAAKTGDGGGSIDLEFEACAMNRLVLSFASAMLVAPYISGSLSNPVERFDPSSTILRDDSRVGEVLGKFPYLLPNVVGAILCLVAMVITHLYLIETLPSAEATATESNGKTTTINHKRKKMPHLGTIQESQSLRLGVDDDEDDEALDNFEPSEALVAAFGGGTGTTDDEADLVDAIRRTYVCSDNIIPVISTKKTRKTMVAGISRRTSVALKDRQERQRRQSVAAAAAAEGGTDGGGESLIEPPTNLTFFLDKDIRRNLIMTILSIMTTTTFWEAFPLFCLSKQAGLGVSEYTIGKILSTSGIIYFLIQPWLYLLLFQRTGLNGSIKASSVAVVPIYFLMAFSIGARDKGVGTLHWQAFAFLSISVSFEKILSLTAFSGLSVSLNRLVIPSHRAQLNALAMRVSGGCMGASPIVAGIFTSLCFSLAPVWGATVLFGTIGLMATAAAISALVFLDPEKEE